MHFAAGRSYRLMPILMFLLPAFIVNPVKGDDSTMLPTIPAEVNLQWNDNTPLYQQTLVIATLNEEKNNGPVVLLRNFQRYARVKGDMES